MAIDILLVKILSSTAWTTHPLRYPSIARRSQICLSDRMARREWFRSLLTFLLFRITSKDMVVSPTHLPVFLNCCSWSQSRLHIAVWAALLHTLPQDHYKLTNGHVLAPYTNVENQPNDMKIPSVDNRSHAEHTHNAFTPQT